MNQTNLNQIHHGGVIRTCDLKALAVNQGLKWSSVLVNVSRWQQQGLLERVTRGDYLLRDVEVHPEVAACLLVPDGYISLESAMARHGTILDRVYHVDLACPRRVKNFSVRGTEIRVSKIPPRLFWGWEVEETLHGPVRLARPEKALLDRLYLDRTAEPGFDYYEEMGLQPDSLDPERFAHMVTLCPKLMPFSSHLREYCRE